MGVVLSYFLSICFSLMLACVGFFCICMGVYLYGLYKGNKQEDFINMINWLDWRKNNGSESTDD